MKFQTYIKVLPCTLFLFIPAQAQDTTSVLQDTTVIFQNTTSVSQDTTIIAPDTPSVSQDSSTIAQDSSFISMAGDCRYPAIASDGKNIFMVWLVAEGNRASLNFKKSGDEGATWSSAEVISNANSDCFPPAIAASGGIIHASWIDFGETIDGEIYYTRSLDSGETWEKNYIAVGNANSARYPLLACAGNNVYLIWQDVENKVFFKCSHNRGVSWGAEILLGKVGKHSCYCFPPAIAAAGEKLTVVWTDYREDRKGLGVSLYGIPVFKFRKNRASTPFNKDGAMVSSVICRRSSDNGRTWGKELVLSAAMVAGETKDEIDNPTMLSDGTLSYLFWLDKRNLPLGETFYARFDPDKQKGPLEGKNLYPNQKRSPKRPAAVFDDKLNIHFTWASFFGGQSIIHYAAINPAGNPIVAKTDLTSAKCRFHSPAITRTKSGVMHVFWFDEPKNKDIWSKIYLKTSKDNGATWKYWESSGKVR